MPNIQADCICQTRGAWQPMSCPQSSDILDSDHESVGILAGQVLWIRAYNNCSPQKCQPVA